MSAAIPGIASIVTAIFCGLCTATAVDNKKASFYGMAAFTGLMAILTGMLAASQLIIENMG